jgi:hypothetical protein
MYSSFLPLRTIYESRMNKSIIILFPGDQKAEKNSLRITMGNVLFLMKMVTGTRRIGISLDLYFTIKNEAVALLTTFAWSITPGKRPRKRVC